METLRKPLSVILGLIAFAVLIHSVLSPFYSRSSRKPLTASRTGSVGSTRKCAVTTAARSI